MKPEEMPVVEAIMPVRFSSRERLIDHVVKHLVEGRDERWQHLIDDRILVAARIEYREGRVGVAINALARRYQAFVSDRLVGLCGQGQSHQHSCEYTWDFVQQARRAVSQIIDSWSEQEKLILAAEAFVKDEQVGTYRLKTAFRPWPRLSASGHRRKARERLRNRQTLKPRVVLQVHDE